MTSRRGWFATLWRGHFFLFDKPLAPPAYGDAAGLRLILIVVILEALRMARGALPVRSLPLALEIAIYLTLALALVRAFAGVRFSQIGFSRWADWNATEKSYFVQVVILINVVFLVVLGGQLRQALAQPGAVRTVFLPYFIFGAYQEVLYRGLLQTELVRRWGPALGILVSNAVFTFGPLHYGYLSAGGATAVPMLVSIFAIGCIFAMVFHRSGNLWMVAIMHGIGNAYAVGAFGRAS